MKRYLILGLIMVMLSSSCERTSIFEGVQIITTTESIVNTALALTFVDAKDGTVLNNENENIRISIAGEDADDVYDVTGDDKEVFVVTKGFLTLGIFSDRVPTASDPLEFVIVVNSNTFLKTSVPIKIYGEGRISSEIALVKLNDPPEGVVVVKETSSVTDGVLDDPINIQTDPILGTNVSVTAPTGMVITDAQGNLLQGILNIRIIYFSSQVESAMLSYPGGLVAEVNEDGVVSIIEFYSAGYVAIDISDENGNRAEFFDNGTLDVEMIISPNTYNPETGGNVQDGDIIPLWSYDADEGIWMKEGDLDITLNTSGNLVSLAQLDHLSYWNWDWKGNACGEGTEVLVCSNVDPDGTALSFRLTITRCSDETLLSSQSYDTKVGEYIRLTNVPDGEPVMLRAYLCGILLGEKKIDDACNGIEELCVNSIEPPTEIDITVNGYCPNSDVLIKPTFAFWYKNLSGTDCNHWFSGWFVDGVAQIRVSLGETYRFVIYYNGNWIEHDSVIRNSSSIGCDSVPFTADICDFFQ